MPYLGRPIKIILTLISLASFGSLQANAQKPAEVKVTFLTVAPEIDGALDASLTDLAPMEFAHEFRFDNPELETPVIRYRLGYTATHLYVHISTTASDIKRHRRGWLWGDGFKILLGKPEPDGATREYYELGFSPSLTAGDTDVRGVLTYNNKQVFRRASEKTLSASTKVEGGTGFEALISWDDIPPYHPLISGDIGFNLYFAKGFETAESGHFPYGFAVAKDEGIWDEEIPERQTVPLQFDRLSPKALTSVNVMQLRQRNIELGQKLTWMSQRTVTRAVTRLFKLNLMTGAIHFDL